MEEWYLQCFCVSVAASRVSVRVARESRAARFVRTVPHLRASWSVTAALYVAFDRSEFTVVFSQTQGPSGTYGQKSVRRPSLAGPRLRCRRSTYCPRAEVRNNRCSGIGRCCSAGDSPKRARNRAICYKVLLSSTYSFETTDSYWYHKLCTICP